MDLFVKSEKEKKLTKETGQYDMIDNTTHCIVETERCDGDGIDISVGASPYDGNKLDNTLGTGINDGNEINFMVQTGQYDDQEVNNIVGTHNHDGDEVGDMGVTDHYVIMRRCFGDRGAISDQQHDLDEVDNMIGIRDVDRDSTKINQQKLYPFNVLDFMGIVLSIGLFGFDLITDILLAKTYYGLGRVPECSVTISVVIASFLVAGTLSTIWFIQDGEKNVLFLIAAFPMATIIRNVSYIYYGVKSKRGDGQRKYYDKMKNCDRDASLLRMFDAFMESTPQLMIQIYIAIHETPDEALHLQIIRPVTMASSWIGVSWSVTSYYRALRIYYAQDKFQENTICGAIGYFLWRAFEIGPRIVAIVMLASMSTLLVILGSVFHWITMVTWSFYKKVKPYSSGVPNIIFVIFIGLVQIFSFMNLSKGNSRYFMIFYYVLFFVENTTIVIFWIYLSNFRNWIFWVSIISVAVGILNIVFMLLYYGICHPKTAMCSNRDSQENKDLLGLEEETSERYMSRFYPSKSKTPG